MASLREMQRSFATALRAGEIGSALGVTPSGNVSVYRNNASITFRLALEATYPVVLKRVGTEFFRQLAFHYRERFPSRSGDLHCVGRDFPRFLDEYLGGGEFAEYAWLADLARIEWARAECAVAAESPALRAEALAGFAPAEFEHLTFGLQPLLRLLSSPFPVFTVWRLNQQENAPSVDQSLGSERGMVQMRHDVPEVRALEPARFAFVSALAGGATLGNAVSSAALDAPAIAESLAFLFSEGLVCSLAIDGQRVGTSS